MVYIMYDLSVLKWIKVLPIVSNKYVLELFSICGEGKRVEEVYRSNLMVEV